MPEEPGLTSAVHRERGAAGSQKPTARYDVEYEIYTDADGRTAVPYSTGAATLVSEVTFLHFHSLNSGTLQDQTGLRVP